MLAYYIILNDKREFFLVLVLAESLCETFEMKFLIVLSIVKFKALYC